jgi:hypothetical protein
LAVDFFDDFFFAGDFLLAVDFFFAEVFFFAGDFLLAVDFFEDFFFAGMFTSSLSRLSRLDQEAMRFRRRRSRSLMPPHTP